MSNSDVSKRWTRQDFERRLADIPYEQFQREYQGEFLTPPQMIRSSVNGDMVVDSPTKVNLECAACGKPLGDNNEPITSGPHKGLRPTDLTVYCATTGKNERVIIADSGIDN